MAGAPLANPGMRMVSIGLPVEPGQALVGFRFGDREFSSGFAE